jgi:hypothetical protein
MSKVDAVMMRHQREVRLSMTPTLTTEDIASLDAYMVTLCNLTEEVSYWVTPIALPPECINK